jgi:adenylate kinase
MGSINTVLLIGKPAAGKGTQAKLLAARHGWRHVSTGDHLRMLAARDDHFGERTRDTLATGGLMPRWSVTHLLVETAMRVPLSEGIIFDGFARTMKQLMDFHEILSWTGRSYRAIEIDVPNAVAIERMRVRAEVENRTDSDTPEKAADRLHIYDREMEPVLFHLGSQQLLRKVNGEGTPDEVHGDIVAFVGAGA